MFVFVLINLLILSYFGVLNVMLGIFVYTLTNFVNAAFSKVVVGVLEVTGDFVMSPFLLLQFVLLSKVKRSTNG